MDDLGVRLRQVRESEGVSLSTMAKRTSFSLSHTSVTSKLDADESPKRSCSPTPGYSGRTA